MKIIVNILLIIFAAIMEISSAPVLSVYGGTLNVVLLAMIALILIKRFDEAVLWAGIGGVMLDVMSPTRFGIYTLELLAIYFIIYYLVRHVFFDPPLYLAILIIIAASALFNLIFIFYNFNLIIYFATIIYNTVVGSIIYYLIRSYYKPKEEVKI